MPDWVQREVFETCLALIVSGRVPAEAAGAWRSALARLLVEIAGDAERLQWLVEAHEALTDADLSPDSVDNSGGKR